MWTRDDTLLIQTPIEMPEQDALRLATLTAQKEISSKVLIDIKRLEISDGWQNYQVIVYVEA